jgi:endonuclease/exonuclease/phosphatase (EEP) superfamily protein YafD
VKRALATLAALSIGASVVAMAGGFWWVFDLFAHFRVQLLAAQIVLIAAFAFRRNWRWSSALIACALLNAAPLGPYLWPGAEVAVDGSGITLLAANVQARNDAPDRLLELVAKTRPDLLLLVEFTPRWGAHIAALDAQYPYQIRVPRTDNFGIALLSRHPFAAARELQLGATIAIDAVVEGPGGTLRLLGVHLMPPVTAAGARERNAQLAALAALAESRHEPLLIAGDFNLSPYSPHFVALLERARLSDARAGRGLDFTWPSFFPPLGIPIDHCLVSEDLVVAEYRRLQRVGSDHYPILVKLARESS